MLIRRLPMHARHANPALTKNSDHPRRRREALGVHVLMAMNKYLRSRAFNVGIERFESDVDTIVPLMDQVRRIVRDENIHGRKGFQRLLHFILFVKEIAARFVAPGTVKPAELQALVFVHCQVKILNRRMKRAGAVVIAFDGENVPAKRHLGDAQDERIRNVPATNQQIRAQLAVEIDLFFVGNNKCSHAII